MKRLLLLLILAGFVPALGHAQTIVAGASCSPAGASGADANGNPMICKQPPGGGPLAWTAVGGGSSGTNPLTPTTALAQQSNLLGWYWILPTETLPGIIDYSNHGNNGLSVTGTNPPTIIAGTGGLQCAFQGGAILLPPALNAATTIQVFTLDSGSVNSVQSPLAGNGAGSTGHAIAINYTSSAVGNAVQTRAFGIQSSSAAAAGFLTGKTFSTGAPIYPSLITLAMGSGTDIFWSDAVQLGVSATGSSQGLQDRGNYQVCGTASGNGDNQNHWMFGQIYAIGFYQGAGLSASDIAQNAAVVHQQMLARGFVFPVGGQDGNGANPGSHFSHWDGDSLSQQFTVAPVLNNYNGIGWSQVSSVQNNITAGAILSNCSSNAGKSYVNSLDSASVEVWWAGTDDFPSSTPIQVYNRHVSCAQAMHAIGAKFIAATMVSRSSEDTQKNGLNGMILANPYPFDIVAHLGSWTNMGADNAFSNATNFPDGVHPAAWLHYNEIEPTLAAAHNHLFGNTSYDTATTYNSAAAAATATTAGSESTNTATITFGATPANCQVGNFITIAGATPSGYNGTWQILTRTGTQITYFNSVTGLGAISVQGTGICPTQQDADNYAILNFGAGNFNLQPCELWAGGSGAADRNVHIMNTNAASSTIGTSLSETINGASTLTIAANSAITLKVVNNATSAAGCSWRTQ